MPTEIITRAEAKAKGLIRYFTGKFCKNQHRAERYCSTGTCCECMLKFNREHYSRNPEARREQSKRRRRENPDLIRAAFKRWYDRWMIEHPGENVKKTNRWLENNPGYRRNRRRNDPNFRLADVMRVRLRAALFAQGTSKSAATFELVGCSVEELCQYLEDRFLDGMTWQNHGYGRDRWHVDHIIPCASFNLLDHAQQRICFHYTNLRPLWQTDNLRKGARI